MLEHWINVLAECLMPLMTGCSHYKLNPDDADKSRSHLSKH